MKKLKLNIDELKVESFEAVQTEATTKGTVVAQLEPTGDIGYTGGCWDTCQAAGCQGTWYNSCEMFSCFIACQTNPYC